MLHRVAGVVGLLTLLYGCSPTLPTSGAASGHVTLRTCPGPTWPQTPCRVEAGRGTPVTFRSPTGSSTSTSTDQTGRYLIRLVPGTYEVTVGFSNPGQLTITAGNTVIADYQLTSFRY
jgi:hypothetical protein